MSNKVWDIYFRLRAIKMLEVSLRELKKVKIWDKVHIAEALERTYGVSLERAQKENNVT